MSAAPQHMVVSATEGLRDYHQLRWRRLDGTVAVYIAADKL